MMVLILRINRYQHVLQIINHLPAKSFDFNRLWIELFQANQCVLTGFNYVPDSTVHIIAVLSQIYSKSTFDETNDSLVNCSKGLSFYCFDDFIKTFNLSFSGLNEFDAIINNHFAKIRCFINDKA